MRQLIFIALILPLLSVLITSCGDAQHPFPTTDQEGLKAELQALIDEQVEDKNIFGTVVKVESTDGSFSWNSAAGDLEVETPYFIASVTKLYTTAVVLKLVDQGLMSLDDRLDQYLGTDILDGLHVYRGTDHAPEITVRQLLGHTSGLPDYFQHKQDGETLEERISQSQDLAWSRAEVWTWAKEMKPEFEPGKPGKAHYSDTNFQLLGEIIEQVSGMSIAEAYEQYIFQPLGLEHTYLYTDPTDNTPKPIYFKEEATSIPMAMASFGADGAIVSTVDEGYTFLRAFFQGELFPEAYLDEIQQEWNKIFFPLEYGTGVSRFQFGAAMTGGKKLPVLVGHSGLSGAFAFYSPDWDVYLTGTVNQIHKPSTSFQLMIQIMSIMSEYGPQQD